MLVASSESVFVCIHIVIRCWLFVDDVYDAQGHGDRMPFCAEMAIWSDVSLVSARYIRPRRQTRRCVRVCACVCACACACACACESVYVCVRECVFLYMHIIYRVYI
jgi:hypothetical protein